MHYTVYTFINAVAKEHGFTSTAHRAESLEDAQKIAACFPFYTIVEWK